MLLDGESDGIFQSTCRNCANALTRNFFYWRFSWIHCRWDWQLERKGEISLSEDWSLSERALTSSCSILQVSFHFQFLLLKFGLCKKKKPKIIYRGVSKSWKVIIVSGNSFSNIRKWKCFMRFKIFFTKSLEAKSYLLQLWTLKSLNLSEKRENVRWLVVVRSKGWYLAQF